MYNKSITVNDIECHSEIRAEFGNKRREGKKYVRGQDKGQRNFGLCPSSL